MEGLQILWKPIPQNIGYALLVEVALVISLVLVQLDYSSCGIIYIGASSIISTDNQWVMIYLRGQIFQ